MPVSATPSRIRSAADAAIVRSTNNTKVGLCDVRSYGQAFTHESFLYRLCTMRISQRKTTVFRMGTEG